MSVFLRFFLLFYFFTSPEMVSAKLTEKNPFVLASIQPEGSKQRQLLVKIYTGLFERMAIPLKIEDMPLERASEDASSGKVDGQFGRIFKYGDQYTNQKRINFPIIQIAILAFVHSNSNIALSSGWDSLIGTPYLVEYQRGMLISRVNLESRIKPPNLSSVTNSIQGLLKLKHRRTDIFIHSDGTVLENIRNNSELFGDIKPIAVMQTVFLYPYVHKKYENMIPNFENTLNEMKRDGTILNYCNEVYGRDSENYCQNWPEIKFKF